MVDVLPDTYPDNNIPSGTGWVTNVEKCENGSATLSVKLDVDEFIYQNLPLKNVTKVEILNIIYSEQQKKRKYCDNLIKKETDKTTYTDNDVNADIDTRLQRMSKIQVLR